MCCGPTPARSSPRRRPGLVRTNTVTGRQHGGWDVLIIASKSRITRRVRFTARGKSADRRRSTLRTARTWRGCVEGCRPTRGALLPTPSARARPHQNRDRSAVRPSRGICCRVRIPWRASRAFFAPWIIGRPPTEHAPRSADLATWRGCVVGARRARSTPRRRPRSDRINTAIRRQHGPQELSITAFDFRDAGRVRSSPRGKSADCPRSTLGTAFTRRGCVVAQRGARSLPCQRPGIVRTNTVLGRWHGVGKVLIAKFESHSTRRVRFTPR